MLDSLEDIIVIHEPITKESLQTLAQKRFGDMVKAVVDIEKQIMALGGELHADEEQFLLDRASLQQDLWGINLYPALPRDQWVEFDSMINIRPSQGNRSRSVQDPERRKRIIQIVNALIRD